MVRGINKQLLKIGATASNVMETENQKPCKVLLYYKFHPIQNPEQFTEEHREFCQEHNLVGRIIIGEEGINGTCAGQIKDVNAYMDYVHSLGGFEDMWFKEHFVEELPFQKLSVRCRKEIVALGQGIDMAKTANYLSPEEFHRMVKQSFHDGSIAILDGRNEIEARVGKFRNAIAPKIKFFREFREEMRKDEYRPLKQKKVLMYCTGGIRCEKASAMLREEGFRDVYQLKGGIYNYLAKFPNGHFEGSCFVFDGRMQVACTENGELASGKDIPEEKIISSCDFCGKASPRI